MGSCLQWVGTVACPFAGAALVRGWGRGGPAGVAADHGLPCLAPQVPGPSCPGAAVPDIADGLRAHVILLGHEQGRPWHKWGSPPRGVFFGGEIAASSPVVATPDFKAVISDLREKTGSSFCTGGATDRKGEHMFAALLNKA